MNRCSCWTCRRSHTPLKFGAKLGKRKNKGKGQDNPVKEETYAVSKEEYDKFISFCRVRDDIINSVNEIEAGWDEHCLFLCQELQIEVPVLDNTIDDAINKLKESVRSFRYNHSTNNKKNKKKNKNWFVPLVKNDKNFYVQSKRKISINSAKEADKNKSRLQKISEICLECFHQTETVIFSEVVSISEKDFEVKSIERSIEETEGNLDIYECEHGNRHPCEICDSEIYYSVD